MLGKPIPLIRGSMLLPFVKEMRARGRNPDTLLKACFCPVTGSIDDPDCIIPTSRLWQVVERLSLECRDINFGWKTAMIHGVYGGGHLGYAWENQSNLAAAIHLYADSLPTFANASKGEILDAGSKVWFLRGTVPRKGSPFSQVEQFAVGTMLHIVRCYLGKDWRPSRIRLVSQPPDKSELDIANDCNELIFNAERAGIEIPKKLLNEGKKEAANLLRGRCRAFRPFPQTLSSVLKQMLKYYLPHYRLTLDNVSNIVELHPRTLNRRLAMEATSFSKVRNYVMADWAKAKLVENDLSNAEISSALGFAYQSAFSRAFRQWTGCTPTEFRG